MVNTFLFWSGRGWKQAEDLQNHQLPVGLIAQLVEHCTGIAEVMGSNSLEAWIFQAFCFTSAKVVSVHKLRSSVPVILNDDCQCPKPQGLWRFSNPFGSVLPKDDIKCCCTVWYVLLEWVQ